MKKQNFYIGNGIVGLFDILGYKSFLDNNDPSGETANEVIRILSSSVDEAKNESLKILKENEGEMKRAAILLSEYITEDLHSIVVADTFVLTMAYLDSAPTLEKQIKWLLFTGILQNFVTRMFVYGLPVRGGISFGKIRIEDFIFVGKPIAEAYEVAQEIEVATGILCESSIEEINTIKHLKDAGAIKDFEEDLKDGLVEFLIPKKENKNKKHFAIPINADAFDETDIRQIVLESFWKHNKDIPLSAMPKADNTEKFIRFLKRRM